MRLPDLCAAPAGAAARLAVLAGRCGGPGRSGGLSGPHRRASAPLLDSMHGRGGGPDVSVSLALRRRRPSGRGLPLCPGLRAGRAGRLTGVAAPLLPVAGRRAARPRLPGAGGGIRRRLPADGMAGAAAPEPGDTAGHHRQGTGLRLYHRRGGLCRQQPELCLRTHPLQRILRGGGAQHPHPGGSGGRGHPVCPSAPVRRAPDPPGAGGRAECASEPVHPVPAVQGEHRADQPEIPRPQAPDRRAAGGAGCRPARGLPGRHGGGHQAVRGPEQDGQFCAGHGAHQQGPLLRAQSNHPHLRGRWKAAGLHGCDGSVHPGGQRPGQRH